MGQSVLYDQTPPQVRSAVLPASVQPGQKVTLRAVLTDSSPIATATAFVQAGMPIPLTRRNGGWESVYPVNLPPGVYPVTFRAVDQAGNVGYGSATLVVDNTAPTVKTVTIAASPPYGYQTLGPVLPTVFYGVGTGSITVTATLTDDIAGLGDVTFATATNAGATYPQNGRLQAVVPHRYTFDANSTFAGTVSIQAADRAGNTVTSNLVLIHDTVPPTITLNATADGLTISLAWSAGDAEAGLKACTLELLTGTTTTIVSTECASALSYPATQDTSYTVRLTATDNVANQATQETTVTVSSVTKYYYHGQTRIAMRKDGQLFYLHGDHLGSTSLTTDANGKVVHDARYLPYGQVRWESGVGMTDFGFTGQRTEADFGLMDYNARYYSQRLGTFIQPDTIVPEAGKATALNRYLYSSNNPINRADPTGHADCAVGSCPSAPGTAEFKLPKVAVTPGDKWLSPSSADALNWTVAHGDLINAKAAEYGVSSVLVSGLISAEIDLDNTAYGIMLDEVTRAAYDEVATFGQGEMSFGSTTWLKLVTNTEGSMGDRISGYANVHHATYVTVQEYMAKTYGKSAPHGTDKADYLPSLLTDEGTIDFTARMARMLADYRTGNTNAHTSDLTVDDMAVIWGAWRAGINGKTCSGADCGYGSASDFHDSTPGPQSQLGRPFFEFFQNHQ